MNTPRTITIAAVLLALSVCLKAAEMQNDAATKTASVKVDRSTLTRKVMCGYQGWFAVPTDAINRGWYHYKLGSTFAPGSCKFDLWPDMSEMDPDEKYAAPGFVTASGAQAYVYSAQNRKTVMRHFKWMSDYGIDGVFMQRFATEVMNGGAGLTQFNNVLESCRAGASQYGRVYAVMYDLSGLKAGQWKKVLADWRTQIVAKNMLKDSTYLYHNGKPVVAVWGIGFNDGRSYTLSECGELIDSLKNHPQYGGNTVMVGVPTHWRTLDVDAVPDSTLLTVIRKADIISPWFVGRIWTLADVPGHAQEVVEADVKWCKSWSKDYLPVVYPGFSWHNMKPDYSLNQIPREKGRFLWRQFYEYLHYGSTMIYQAMFDEIDEGTAIFKVTNDPPVGASTFVTYEGLPSDHYLKLVGEASRMVRGEIPMSQEPPSTVGVPQHEEGKKALPQDFQLNQNFPNPFNPTTNIRYTVPVDSFVEVAIYNVLGQKVKTLVSADQHPGSYSLIWNGVADSGMMASSGVYLCRLESSSGRITNKMIFSK